MILSGPVGQTVTKCKDTFVSMHFSDHRATDASGAPKNGRKELHFEFKCPEQNDMKSIEKLMEMSLSLIDRVARFKLSAAAKAKAQTKRDQMLESELKAQHQARQELAQKKKMDKIAEEKKRK